MKASLTEQPTPSLYQVAGDCISAPLYGARAGFIVGGAWCEVGCCLGEEAEAEEGSMWPPANELAN